LQIDDEKKRANFVGGRIFEFFIFKKKRRASGEIYQPALFL